MHYDRWRHHGDPLTVKEIHGDDEARFWSYVDRDGPIPIVRPDLGRCWLWTGEISHGGYARLNKGRAHVFAHRFAYELLVAPIPEGLTIDHLCRNCGCVNPAHLEPVSMYENLMRGDAVPAKNARKTHCKYGHPFDAENTYWRPTGGRGCRICRRQRDREYAQRQAA